MASIFMTDDDTITLTVHYTLSVNRAGSKVIKVIDDKKAQEMLTDPKKAPKVQTLNVKARQMSWKVQQQCFRGSALYNPATGSKETDWTEFSDLQLKGAIVDWDAQDDNGRPFPVSNDLVDQLPAPIANALLSKYREALVPEEEDAGE